MERRSDLLIQELKDLLGTDEVYFQPSYNAGLDDGYGESVNDTIAPSQQISILADPYARNHVGSMKYVKWMGTAWKISEVTVEYPRLILTLGGAYNGATVRSSDTGA